jgi:hypothetical protein
MDLHSLDKLLDVLILLLLSAVTPSGVVWMTSSKMKICRFATASPWMALVLTYCVGGGTALMLLLLAGLVGLDGRGIPARAAFFTLMLAPFLGGAMTAVWGLRVAWAISTGRAALVLAIGAAIVLFISFLNIKSDAEGWRNFAAVMGWWVLMAIASEYLARRKSR